MSLTSGIKLHTHLWNLGVQFIFSLNSSNLICRGTDISKYFRESLGLRDNESDYIIIHLFLNENVSQRAHDVNTTSPQRRCNVMTLHQRWADVVWTSCARWDEPRRHKTYLLTCAPTCIPAVSTESSLSKWSNVAFVSNMRPVKVLIRRRESWLDTNIRRYAFWNCTH